MICEVCLTRALGVAAKGAERALLTVLAPCQHQRQVSVPGTTFWHCKAPLELLNYCNRFGLISQLRKADPPKTTSGATSKRSVATTSTPSKKTGAGSGKGAATKAGRGRRGGRGTGRFGRGGKRPRATKESLDSDLEKYMMKDVEYAKSKLDNDLDTYMNDAEAKA